MPRAAVEPFFPRRPLTNLCHRSSFTRCQIRSGYVASSYQLISKIATISYRERVGLNFLVLQKPFVEHREE